MNRTIIPLSSTLHLLGEQSFKDDDALKIWLNQQAETYALTLLLAHADDGVIWGRFDNDWQFSYAYFPGIAPELRLVTLRECRIFGEKAEVYLWRDEANTWRARLIQDGAGAEKETFDELQILWGTEARGEKGGFLHLVDGAMKNPHTPPAPKEKLHFDPENNRRPLRLRVRHYLDIDKNVSDLPADLQVGLTYIAFSRLVALEPEVN